MATARRGSATGISPYRRRLGLPRAQRSRVGRRRQAARHAAVRMRRRRRAAGHRGHRGFRWRGFPCTAPQSRIHRSRPTHRCRIQTRPMARHPPTAAQPHRLTSVHAGLSFRWSAVFRHSPYRRIVALVGSSRLRCSTAVTPPLVSFRPKCSALAGASDQPIGDHRRRNLVEIASPITVRQSETHIQDRLIGRSVLRRARYE